MPSTITPAPLPANVPVLDIDQRRTLTDNDRLERTVVANLIAHLARAGFRPVGVDAGHVYTFTETPREVLTRVFTFGVSRVVFERRFAPAQRHYVQLTRGKGADIVSDWEYFPDDRDGFGAAMNEFEAQFSKSS